MQRPLSGLWVAAGCQVAVASFIGASLTWALGDVMTGRDRTLGRYALLESLGRGGQGRVVEAEQRGPGGTARRVALKILEEDGAALYREARMFALLRHPHLVDVYEVGVADGTWYCAMELCDRSLDSCPPLSSRAVVEVGLQVCDALAYAHDELELVHLDLKPANLLLRDGAVKVADLGISRARGFDGDGLVRGTPRFMPPEQRVGAAVDARADVFALGMLLAELATGAGAVDATWVGNTAPTGAPLALPGWLNRIVERCTEPTPADRYQSMQALAAGLRAVPVEGPSLAQTFPSAAPVAAPVAPPALVGRAETLAALGHALAKSGVCTLKGSAGIGKTRLAQELVRTWEGAAWFVDLSATTTTAGLVAAVAGALGVPLGSPGQGARQLADALRARGPALLALDNLEQLAGRCDVLEQWGRSAPQLRLLLTSRVPVGLAGEHLIEVPPLGEADAVALVVDRARARGVDVSGDPALVRLARNLDGVPLALELAAGRIGVLSPTEVVDRLGLALLRSGATGVSDRQATLHGALDWSWQLLSPPEQTTLAQLAVFRGGFSLEDARAVVDADGDPLELVHRLSEHSLVATRGDRLALLATVAAFAEMQLATHPSADATRIRHATWFARHGTAANLRALTGPAQLQRTRAIEADLSNLEAAVEHGLATGQPELAARAALAAAHATTARGPLELGIALLSRALTACPAERRADLLVLRATLRTDAAQGEAAERDLAEAAASPNSPLGPIAQERGDAAMAAGRFAEAEAHFSQAFALQQAAGESTGRALLCLGAAQLQQSRLERAEATLTDALAELRRVGDAASEATTLANLGIAQRRSGRPALARANQEQSMAINERLGRVAGVASNQANLAILAAYDGQLDRAHQLFSAAVDNLRQMGARSDLDMHLGNLAELCLVRGDLEAARRHAAEAIEDNGITRNASHQGFVHIVLGRIEVALGDLTAARAHFEAALPVRMGNASLELARLALIEREPTAALEHGLAAVDALAGDTQHRILAEVAVAVARSQLGEVVDPGEFDAAFAEIRPLSAAYAVEVLCAAAEATGDRARLERAITLAAEAEVPARSPTGLVLARTREQLG